MQDRIAVLERDVATIKVELEVIRRECIDAADLSTRTSHMESDIVVLKGDVSQLQKDVAQLRIDVSQLQKDVAQLLEDVGPVLKQEFGLLMFAVAALQSDVTKLKEEFSLFGKEMTRMSTELAHCATKEDLKELKADLRGWMMVIAIALLSAQVAMFSYMQSILPAHASGQHNAAVTLNSAEAK